MEQDPVAFSGGVEGTLLSRDALVVLGGQLTISLTK
jgi:PP-loop superfamily ATP-utilizing enzyme